MKKYAIILFSIVVVIISVLSYNTQHNINKEKYYEKKELLEDLNQVVNIIKKENPMLHISEEELNNYASYYGNMIEDKMDFISFYRLLASFSEKIGCGHTYLDLPGVELNKYFNRKESHLPLDIKVIDDKLYVRSMVYSSDIPVGSEIISIDNKSAQEIIDILLDRIPSDGRNITFKYGLMNKMFSRVYFDYVDNRESFKITYIDPNSNKSTKIIDAELRASIDGILQSQNGESREITTEFFENYAVLTIPTFEYYSNVDNKVFQDKIDEFFKTVKENSVNNVIIDIQDNGGGNPLCSDYLYSYISPKKYTYFDTVPANGISYSKLATLQNPKANVFEGNLFTLISSFNFSTTAHFVSLLKYNEIGTLIGEPTGSTYRCTASQKDIVLKNTDINYIYSTEIYKTAVEGIDGKMTIEPDIFAPKTIDDYINNRNMARLKAVNLIN
ncbi:S41 family peptidase [Sporosalibacterium faouarense]|uniref:S41 family peptidase n=1 Tax=Sporosalibacterium faouarense TaxID=516123 RepID=UPI00192C5208|nr:S41 family peptidase [Sporosalibacterium faouarense]